MESPLTAKQLLCDDDLRVLNSINGQKREDCKYIRSLLDILYRDQPDKIPFRCLTGCREGIVKRNGRQFFREKKEAISPNKRILTNKLFRARIHGLDIPTEEKLNRVGQQYINHLIKSALTTLQSSHNSDKGGNDDGNRIDEN